MLAALMKHVVNLNRWYSIMSNLTPMWVERKYRTCAQCIHDSEKEFDCTNCSYRGDPKLDKWEIKPELLCTVEIDQQRIEQLEIEVRELKQYTNLIIDYFDINKG